MKRIKKVIFLLIIFLSFNVFLCATVEEDIKFLFSQFINCYNNNNREIYKYIDSNSSELYSNIRNNIGKGTLTYDENISFIEISDTEYKIAALMKGTGKVYNSEWNFQNKYIYFTYKYNNDKKKYLLSETDFFNASGISILRKEYSKILIKSLKISGTIFIILLGIVFIISKFFSGIKEISKK